MFTERMTSIVDDDFVVFLIGMRINSPLKIHKWLPVISSMNKILKELDDNPDLGLISYESWFGRTSLMLQYWKSFEHLERYALTRDGQHMTAWSNFNLKIAKSAEVGIWHETYSIKQGSYECVYHNMPLFGLGKVGNHVSATNNFSSARKRMNNTGNK